MDNFIVGSDSWTAEEQTNNHFGDTKFYVNKMNEN